MAKIIQMMLDFAGGAAPAPASNVCAADSVVSDTCADFDAMATRQGIDLSPMSPCGLCPMQGMCDDDECGMKCFFLDSTKAPHGSWDDYFERQKARIHSWLEAHPLTL